MKQSQSTSLITPQRETVIRYLLGQSTPELQKRGLQKLCLELEGRKRPYNLNAVVSQVIGLSCSRSVMVRRWLYKSIALLGLGQCEEFLASQITDHESDAENVSWATSALFAVAPEASSRKTVARSSRFNETHLELSAQLFDATSYVPTGSQQLMLLHLEDNVLTSKWFCLLFGYHRTDDRIKSTRFPTYELVQELTRHHDADVSEYAIWALWRNSSLRNGKLPFDTTALLHNSPAGVRRWAYRLMAKTQKSFSDNIEVFEEAMKIEQAEHAKEGLALALTKNFHPKLEIQVASWFGTEPSLVVRVALLEHLSRFASRSKLYQEILLRLVRGEDTETKISTTLVMAIASESGARQVRQAAEGASQRAFPPSRQTVFEGDIYMVNEKRTIINKTDGGALNIGNMAQGDANAQSARLNIQTGIQQDLLQAMDSYVKAIENSTELDVESKNTAASALNDIRASRADAIPERRKLTFQKALLVLQGLASTLPKATEFVQNTEAFVHAARAALGI